jgi:hypothetical protein
VPAAVLDWNDAAAAEAAEQAVIEQQDDMTAGGWVALMVFLLQGLVSASCTFVKRVQMTYLACCPMCMTFTLACLVSCISTCLCFCSMLWDAWNAVPACAVQSVLCCCLWCRCCD